MAERIKANMSMMEIVMTIGEGNPGAIMVAMNMLENPMGLFDILLCDSLDIRGARLYMLNNDCCKRNNEWFNLTLTMIKKGVFSYEEIHKNLSMVRAIPFISMELFQKYGKTINPSSEKWNEFCFECKATFLEKMSQFNQDSPKRA